MSRTLMLIAAVMAAAPSAASWACGACDEDKVAATYDHAVVERAKATHRQVVFVAIDGPVGAAQIIRRIVGAASKVEGIVIGTLRTSQSPTAFSFVLDGKKTPEAVVSDFQKAVGEPDARFTVLRVMRDGALVGPDQVSVFSGGIANEPSPAAFASLSSSSSRYPRQQQY